MDAVTTEFFIAMSITAGSFFRLRPSDFSATDRPLLKRRSVRESFHSRDICVRKRLCFTTGAGQQRNDMRNRLRTVRQPIITLGSHYLFARNKPLKVTQPIEKNAVKCKNLAIRSSIESALIIPSYPIKHF